MFQVVSSSQNSWYVPSIRELYIFKPQVLLLHANVPTTSTRFTFYVENHEKLNYLALKRYASDVLLIFPEFILKQQTWIFTGMKAELLFITKTRDDSSRTKSEHIKMSLADAKSGSSFEETADRI